MNSAAGTPYNVTEDADIGIRLARFKFKTQIINTYTYEEATISVKSWIRQRSRWDKGHVQTLPCSHATPNKTSQRFRDNKIYKIPAYIRGRNYNAFIKSVSLDIINHGAFCSFGFWGILPKLYSTYLFV